MTIRWLAVCVIGCLGVSCLSGCGKTGPPTAIEAHEAKFAPGHAAPRVIVVSMADDVGNLQRPPVKFNHDQHTMALESDGCRVCHNTDDSHNLLFEFPKDRDQNDLMESYHDSCIGCHSKRTKEGQESGPVTCGECHEIERVHHSKAYEPVLPEYYEGQRDIYHTDCTACHRKSGRTAHHAGPLDWQKFYVTQKDEAEANWPPVVFDYLLHDKHNKARMGQCFECHDITQERWSEVMAAGKMPSAEDLGLDLAQTNGHDHRASAHARCINCHLGMTEAGVDTGPLQCGDCHQDDQRTVEELAGVPRPMCERQERLLIQLDQGANLKAVAFNHASHVANSRACQDCHHKTFQPCQECHTVQGCEKGGGVTLAEAHHDVSSTHSCVGCHEAQKSKPDCAGCHQNMQRGLVMSSCTGCHTGSLEALDQMADLPKPADLIPDDVKAEMKISVEREYGPFKAAEKEYLPAPFPHLAIVQRLTHISNKSTLARHFHTDKMTICSSCHHSAPLEAKAHMPPCATCHTARGEPESPVPTLLGAYHQQCLGCHQRMDPGGAELYQDCSGCHEEKAARGKHSLAARKRD